MSSQSVVPRSPQDPRCAARAPGSETKLKSERVQLDVQLSAPAQQRIAEVFARGLAGAEEVVVTFRVRQPAGIARPGTASEVGAVVEAGPAGGMPDQNRQLSARGKENDHADS